MERDIVKNILRSSCNVTLILFRL